MQDYKDDAAHYIYMWKRLREKQKRQLLYGYWVDTDEYQESPLTVDAKIISSRLHREKRLLGDGGISEGDAEG